MATDVERLIVRLEASQAKFEKQLAQANQTANRRSRQIEARFARMNKNLSRSFSGLGSTLTKAFAVAGGIRGVQTLLDSATRIDNALKVAGLSGAELEKVYDRLRESAIKNAAPLETLVTLYGRASLVQKELNVSQEEMLNFTDKIALALRVSGQSAAESSGAILQLSQALGSGVVRAEEFNSVLEGALPIAQAAAAGLKEAGGSVSRLRQLVVDGKISSEAFFRAFEAGSVILEEKVAGASLTTSQALENVRTASIDAMRDFAKGSLAAESIGDAFQMLADVINGTDFEAFGEEVRKVLGWLNDLREGIEWVRNLAPAIGSALGTDRLGEMLTGGAVSKEFLGGAITVQSTRALQKRIDNAFADTVDTAGALTEKTLRDWADRNNLSSPVAGGKVERIPERETVSPVSLSDFSVPSGKSGGGSRGSRRGREDSFARETRQIQDRTAAILAETQAQSQLNPLINDYGYAVEFAAAKQELINAAKQAGLSITPQLEQNIEQLASSYAQASADAERLAEKQERVRKTSEDLRDLGKDVFSGFISDMRNGVDAAEALSNALNKIADKLIEMALSNLFSDLGGGGGLLGLFGFAKGGIAANGKPVPLPRYANGGISRSAAIFGEAGPEAAVPLPDGRRIPVDLRVPQGMSGQGGGDSTVQVVLSPDLEARILEQAAGQSVKIVQAAAPGIVDTSTAATQAASRNRPGFFR